MQIEMSTLPMNGCKIKVFGRHKFTDIERGEIFIMPYVYKVFP